MGSCLSTPVDFEGEVSLYHFDLHRVVGKGAFGKVSISPSLLGFSYLDPVASPGWLEAARRARLCGCGSTCSVAFVPQVCCACFAPAEVVFWSAASGPIESCLLERSVSGDSFPCGLTKNRWIVGVGPRGGTQEVKEAVRIEVH